MSKKANPIKEKITKNDQLQKGMYDPHKKWYVLILVVISFLFYANTCQNEYCLDDAIVITENTSTQKGFSGITEHFSQDLLYGYTHTKGRKAANAGWRPLSLITYSIEIGIFGRNHPGISHFINILL